MCPSEPIRIRTALLLFLSLLLCDGLRAQSGFRIEGGTFLPYNVPMPLTIHQSGEPDIHITARYSSEPFVVPICWIWRIGLWSDGRAWELEGVHHKIFLDNRSAEVENFSVSHGLNQLTINRAWVFSEFEARVGAGVILAHPESTIRGKTMAEEGGFLNLGYRLTGPTVQGAVGKCFPLAGALFLTTELKLSAYHASVPVSEGDAQVWGILAQLTMMIGWQNE